MRVNMGREGRTSSSLSANGGTMLGSLILANGPSQPLEAATKYYVDTAFANLNANNVVDGVLPISSLPGFTGDATSNQGNNIITLANLGVNPGSYAKVIVDSKGRVTGNDVLSSSDLPVVNWSKIQNEPTTVEGYGITDALTTAGGTFTGNLSVGVPTQSLSAVNKQYVDSALSGNSAVVGDIIRKPYATTPVGFLRCNGGLVDKTTYSDLYAVIGDSFANNSIKGSGKPWSQQYQFNSAQSSDINNWTAGTSLPGPLHSSQAIVTKNRVYLIGGGNATVFTSTVYTAPINADGSLGTWTTGTALPGAVSYSSVIVIKNRVYLIGGRNESVYLSTVYTAVINADGTLGAWTTTSPLPTASFAGSTIVTKNRVYHISGWNSSAVSITYSAAISADGTLGSWTQETSSLPNTLNSSQVVVTKNRVYLLGGWNGSTAISTVYTAVINVDGTLGTWAIGTSLPGPLHSSQAIVTKNRVYLLAGAVSVSVGLNTVYTAPINLDGTIGTWGTGTSLPTSFGWSSAIVVSNKIYLLGGYHNGALSSVYSASFYGGFNDYSAYYSDDNVNYLMPGSGQPWRQQYQINSTQANDITGWTTGVALPYELFGSQAIVTKNRVYLIGGNHNGSYSSNIYTATINSDGTLGTWSSGGYLPIVLGGSQAIVTKNRVYLISGWTTGGSGSISNIYTASINADGTLGTWSISGSLPVSLGLGGSQIVITSNKVYLINIDIYTASINSDGTLGTWSISGTFPIPLVTSQVIVTKNRIYTLGGRNNSTGLPISTIYTALINSDGSIGVWSTGGSLPTVIHHHQCFVTKNKVYILGGYDSSVSLSSVYSAVINADGTLGTWTTGTALPIGIAMSHVILTNNRVYLLGGESSGLHNSLSTVYTASILEGLNDYSAYYDGSISPLVPIDPTTLFALPDFSVKEKNGINFYIKY